MTGNRDAWAEVLNPDLLRAKLVSAGLFLLAHEMLLESIRRHPLRFFSDTWTADGAEQSTEYQKEVLARDPKGKADPVRGSIAWLRYMDVLSEEDENAIRRITDERNRLAHELAGIVLASEPHSFVEHFPTLVALVSRIEKWWIIKVEVETDPGLAEQEIDPDQVVPGVVLILHMLSQVALGEGEVAWELHRWLVQEWPTLH